MLLLSNTVPQIEIQMSNEPVAFVISGNQIKTYKIINKGNYFIINERRTRGIYTIKGTPLQMGKTSIYFYHVEETNPIDPLMASELNKWVKTNQLTTVTPKDIKQGARLRILSKIDSKVHPIQKLKSEEKNKLENIEKEMNEASTRIQSTEESIRENYDKNIQLSPIRKSFILLDHLLETKQIDDKEYARLQQKLENYEINFDTLIEALHENHVLRVYEPLDLNVERWVNDLGAQNARELAGFVQDLRNNKKGLADMTSKPVQSFLSAGIILSIGIVALLAVVLIPQALPGITGGHGVNLNPFSSFLGGGGHFIFGLLKDNMAKVISIFS